MSWVDYGSFFSPWMGCGSSSFIVLGALCPLLQYLAWVAARGFASAAKHNVY